jgi:deoxyribodipyrimidine photolyase
VLPIFIFDTNILDQLPSTTDRRVAFIHNALNQIQQQLTQLGSSLLVYHDTPPPSLIMKRRASVVWKRIKKHWTANLRTEETDNDYIIFLSPG